MTEQDTLPWYRGSTDASPFALFKLLCSSKASAFVSSAAFPWHLRSLDSELYWGTGVNDAASQESWKTMVQQWYGSVVVGTTGCAYLFRRTGNPYHIKIPRQALQNNEQAESVVRAVAWGLHPPTNPVLILAASRSIFVFDLSSMTIVGKLRGHGGEITSIAVHPSWPYMFLTTSRDLSTRLYNLQFTARREPNNPPWPPNKGGSLAGPAFGLHSSEPEGDGAGRCVGVLVGNRSGGHQGAVYQAAWHPTSDLIATCGMDHTVKIWRMPVVDMEKLKQNKEHLAREDKPLFSTDLIHKSRVIAVAWLSDDVLVSCSAPALMRGGSVEEMYEEPGEIVVWQWLAYDRFLKQGQIKPIMRGCVSDYRNSESFKILSVYALPMQTKSMQVFVSPTRTHDPLLLVPDGKEIRIFNISHFTPRPPPEFPLYNNIASDTSHEGSHYDEDSQLADALSQNLRVGEGATRDMRDEDEDEDGIPAPVTYARPKPERKLFDEVPSWVVSTQAADEVHDRLPDIDSCEMAWGGEAIIGIGKKGTFFHWKLRHSSTNP
ncbi:hypothetical protein PHLGIDRAFT_473083 [Phlebiopsis gigantea 11061_1 CR5-6]|uniref:Uncharacterized protein n=1 Tax=Phlebiopsis gigantea (strain 11061_1 CR5-6) TaxID=745531 RepID=A0A0C3SD05_PHLG1|nr:hypothetical protein PHLGIDRAFT_473083 [Phlebiopsis gigantea 11061_1 CR5-6]